MVKDFKYLGVVLDSRLKFDKHVKKLSKTIKNNLNYFKLFRHHIPIKATQLYMHAMIVSHMSYCVTVGRQAFKTTVKLIASLYNQTLKIMAKKPIKTKIKLTQDIKIFNTNVAYPFQGDREAGDNPSWHWAMVGYTLDTLPVHHRADIEGQTTIHVYSHTYWQFRAHPQVWKQSFFPPSSSASFQEYFRPHRATENDSKRCISYFRPTGDTEIHHRRRRRDGACSLSLRSVYKQTVDGETEHNKKKMKMACTMRTESFVWTVNEVELLLWLTLNYNASKLQERLNIFYEHVVIVVVVVDIRHHRVQRSEARGRGVGWWRHRFGKYADSPSTRKREGCLFGFFHPETRF